MASDPKGGGVQLVDDDYEFVAPRFFDFLNEETEEQIRTAELWFETSLSYAPSPFMPKIKEGRTVQIDSLCDFGSVEQTQKELEKDVIKSQHHKSEGESTSDMGYNDGTQQEADDGRLSFEFAPSNSSKPLEADKSSSINAMSKEDSSLAFPAFPVDEVAPATGGDISSRKPNNLMKSSASMKLKQRMTEACTPKTQRIPTKGATGATSSMKHITKKIDSSVRKPSALKMTEQSSHVQSSKSAKLKSVTKPAAHTAKGNIMASDIAQQNQAIKKQKLDNGGSRQILNVKIRELPHKSKQDASPYISTAEMVNKFQSRTRDIDIPHVKLVSHESTISMIQRRPKLTLTRPKEPVLGTAQRYRAVRIKSSMELEEEMMAKIPKFKARPVNKKILEATSLPPLPRTVPEAPEFKVFNLKTMERAHQHSETASVVSSADSSAQNQRKPLKLSEPRPPLLATSLRARPLQIKSSEELEAEELQKVPKFKARPLNKKILESKGDLGLFYNPKPQVTTPQEFHFATNERLGRPPLAVTELFDKLSLHSESSFHDQDIPRLTVPNPFHLHTEDRGLLKEKQLSVQILERQLVEEKARIPKANPYPYTTDYPVIPPKPQPKECTRPEAFQLESVVRHEEELRRIMEEKKRLEKEEAQRRLFRAQPILKEDPIPLPERERKPLTDVQEFVLHVDHRAVERSEFDRKIKEKEIMYKRQREENETAQQIEEEKAVKQMRRTMVPRARPLPKFDHPFQPQKSDKETTKPKSPQLRVKLREERRHVHMR